MRAGADDALRFPVQLVIRDGQDFRGLAGTVASGSIAVGEEVVDAVSARRARVARIAMMGRELASASAGQAVVIGLDRDLDLSRGAVLGVARDAPASRMASTRGWCGCRRSPSIESAATCCAQRPTSCPSPRSASEPTSTWKR